MNGVADPPIMELQRLIHMNGGELVNYKVPETTHIVCDHLTDAQLKKELNTIRRKTYPQYVVVKWITESIREKKRLQEHR